MKKYFILISVLIIAVAAYYLLTEKNTGVQGLSGPISSNNTNTSKEDSEKNYSEKKKKNSLRDKTADVSLEKPDQPDQHDTDELEDLKENAPDAYKYHVELAKIINKGYGLTKPIENLDHPQVKSVIEALKTKKFPERLSVAVKPNPFDHSRYTTDKDFRQQYLDTCEPGRCHQSLEPGEGVKKIQRTAPFMHEITQGEKTILSVSTGISGAPVTFTSLDLGQMGNGLTSQTVECDENGNAQVEFFGVSGAAGDAVVLSSSPMTSGQIKFQIFTKVN